ncbi:putative integrase [Legionella parisiensis]|uniref:Integrase n=1 Tax=Legionella parisiensis TaxID=45071 RepID=A0A1E5JU56_9GAMM|nr:putative integrase [Legionella parisiensis]OEH48049.1 hypothetical protein lpari_00920 [Legionella parisiensis]STX75860.1 integrase [Legionella parisiensis]
MVGAYYRSDSSSIAQKKTYKQYLRQYQTETEKLELKNCHGLRHAYAQKRYHEITNQLSPDKLPFKCQLRVENHNQVTLG